MKRCVDMTKAMGQVHSVQTFDQQLYAIAKQVEWAIPRLFATIQYDYVVFATFLVSLVLGFGGNVTASSDKSDQKLSGSEFIKSFLLHQLKKADNHFHQNQVPMRLEM
jgi:hypothetical protein